jgi:hypothetical protein
VLGHDFGFGLLRDRSPLACRQFWVVAAERDVFRNLQQASPRLCFETSNH